VEIAPVVSAIILANPLPEILNDCAADCASHLCTHGRTHASQQRWHRAIAIHPCSCILLTSRKTPPPGNALNPVQYVSSVFQAHGDFYVVSLMPLLQTHGPLCITECPKPSSCTEFYSDSASAGAQGGSQAKDNVFGHFQALPSQQRRGIAAHGTLIQHPKTPICGPPTPDPSIPTRRRGLLKRRLRA